MKRYCMAIDLKDDPAIIEEYIRHHFNVWPEVKESIIDSGILTMEIYNVSNRLFMLMETSDDFSFQARAKSDATNKKVQEWENLMLNFQQPLAGSKPGEKWMLMERIFELHSA